MAAKLSHWQQYLVMLLSFMLASVLSVYPLSADIAIFRPMWLTLVLIFWLVFQPKMMGVMLAFLIGLAADFLTDSRLGQQALCAVLVAFFVKFMSGYLRRLSAPLVWLLATGCLLLYQVSLILLHFFTQAIFAPELLWSVLISLLIWPLLVALLSPYAR